MTEQLPRDPRWGQSLADGAAGTALLHLELCRRYSNRQDLLNPLVSVLEKIKSGADEGSQPDVGTVCGRQPGVWRITDRLTD